MKNQSDLPIQTLRLSDREKSKLLWAIEEANKQAYQEDQRQLRLACTHNEAVLTLKSAGGGETRLAMLARNLSRWGMALVHGRYVHPETRCAVAMQDMRGLWRSVPGIVRHARHIQGAIHELGIKFDEPIDLSEFCQMSSAEETRYLRELVEDAPDPDNHEVVQLSSRVLVVDDFSCDRKLLGHWLNRAGLTATAVADARNASVQVQEQVYDLLLIDCQLDRESGIELIKELRYNQFIGPIIAMSAEESDELKQASLDAGANRFLAKPLNEEELTSLAFELIGIDASSDTSPIFSEHNSDSEFRPLINEFTRHLSDYVDDLRDANAQNNYETLALISRQLKGAGEGYGFPAISEHAGELLSALHQSDGELETIRQQANNLIALLNRVKGG